MQIRIASWLMIDVRDEMPSRMFKFITKTWNPVIGCKFNCTYCWARKLAEEKLKPLGGKYSEGFRPKLIQKELNKRFKAGEYIFVSDMGDLFGEWVPKEWIIKVLDAIGRSPDATFLLQTKNPERYHDFLMQFPKNVILGATIESNRHYPEISKAPAPKERYWWMSSIYTFEKFLSIEPEMDFDLDILVEWIRQIKPKMVAVGYDNYSNNLVEPSKEKTLKLIEELKKFTEVQLKTIREKR